MKRSRTAKSRISILAVVLFANLLTVVNSNAATGANNSFTQLNICGATHKEICKVGQIGPGGGTIFFVDYRDIYKGFNYFEVAPANWAGSLGVDPTAQWCSNINTKIETTLNSWTSRAVGIGISNSKTMLKNCSYGAANLIADYNRNSRSKKKDWFLPSIGELILLTANLQGLAGLLVSDYWSSSGYSDIGGWGESVDHGYQGSAAKETLYHVRPIREF